MALMIVINCTFIVIKNNIFFFWRMNLCILMCVTFSYVPWLSCIFFFYRDASLFDLLNEVINKHTDRHLKADDTLLKIKIRGLLIKTLKVLSVLRMR